MGSGHSVGISWNSDRPFFEVRRVCGPLLGGVPNPPGVLKFCVYQRRMVVFTQCHIPKFMIFMGGIWWDWNHPQMVVVFTGYLGYPHVLNKSKYTMRIQKVQMYVHVFYAQIDSTPWITKETSDTWRSCEAMVTYNISENFVFFLWPMYIHAYDSYDYINMVMYIYIYIYYIIYIYNIYTYTYIHTIIIYVCIYIYIYTYYTVHVHLDWWMDRRTDEWMDGWRDRWMYMDVDG